jgi:hypothetical protein
MKTPRDLERTSGRRLQVAEILQPLNSKFTDWNSPGAGVNELPAGLGYLDRREKELGIFLRLETALVRLRLIGNDALTPSRKE